MLAKAKLPGAPSKLLNPLESRRRVAGRVGKCRNQNRQLSKMGTAKAVLEWRSTGSSQSRNLGRTVHARRPTLDRDRYDTGSRVFVNESDTVASCFANESIKNCQHEENRSAANAPEYNQSDHIKQDIWASYRAS
jgi:hypothetical protein